MWFNEPFAISPYLGLYLDMHGLIFETSICYWQDQPDIFPTWALWDTEPESSAPRPRNLRFLPPVSFTRRRQQTSFQSVGIRFTTAKLWDNIVLARRSKPTPTQYSFRVYFPAEARKPLSLLQWSMRSGRTSKVSSSLLTSVQTRSHPPSLQ